MRRLRIRGRSSAHRDLEGRLVWIFGSPRSGSTWLLNLLAADPATIKIDEPGIGAHLGVTMTGITGLPPVNVPTERSRLIDFRLRARDYFFCDQYRDVWQPLLRNLILERMAAQIRTSGKSRPIALIKEPHGSQAADLLLSALPNSRVIFLLRDGRDVVDSAIDAATADWGGAEKIGLEAASLDRLAFIRDRAHAWLWRTEVVTRAFEEHPPELRELVRYEDLLADAETTLIRLSGWLGLANDHDQIRNAVEVMAFDKLPAHRRGSGNFARAASPGLWRRNLSDEEQILLLSIIGPKLEELGYA